MSKKTIYIVLGALLIISPLLNQELIENLTHWDNARQAGENIGGLILPAVGVYLMIRGLRKKH